MVFWAWPLSICAARHRSLLAPGRQVPGMMVSALLPSLRHPPQGQEALNSQTLSLVRAAALPAAMHLVAASILVASLSAAFVAASILVASLGATMVVAMAAAMVTLLEAMAT